MRFIAALLTFLFFLSFHSFGQNGIVQIISVAGANGSNSNASVDWTVGQIAVTTLESDQAILSQGLLQENILVTQIEQYSQIPEIKVFPNPTSKDLIITISESRQLNYNLTDLNGKLILKGQFLNTENRIDLKDLPVGVYILHFSDNNHNDNSYKIIKL